MKMDERSVANGKEEYLKLIQVYNYKIRDVGCSRKKKTFSETEWKYYWLHEVTCDSQGKFRDFLAESWSSAEHSFGIS